MKCTYTSKNGQMTFEFEAADAKDIFAQRSMVELHDEECCGLCKSAHIRCEVRKSGEYTYYEMRCQACGARLDFGQYKDMKNLFVKRDNHPETNGWYIYEGADRGHEEEPPPARQHQSPPMNGNGNGHHSQQQSSLPKAPVADVANLQQWITYSQCDTAKILAHYKIKSLSDILDKDFDDCIAKVKAKYSGFMLSGPRTPQPTPKVPF
jgi:hypothetical protein